MWDATLLSKRQINNGPAVFLPDYIAMKDTNVVTLSMPSLPTKARIACELSDITKSLLSTLFMCDEGYETRFTKKEFHDTFKGVIILKGKRDYETYLWRVPIESTKKLSTHHKNSKNILNA